MVRTVCRSLVKDLLYASPLCPGLFPSKVSSRILDEARRLHISVEDLLGLPIKGKKRPVTAASSSAVPSTSAKDASSSMPPPAKRFRFGFKHHQNFDKNRRTASSFSQSQPRHFQRNPSQNNASSSNSQDRRFQRQDISSNPSSRPARRRSYRRSRRSGKRNDNRQ